MPRILLGLATAIVVVVLLALEVPATVELPARDLAMKVLPGRGAEATAVIAIDERSLQEIGPWPWTREQLATLVDRCAEAGARAAVLDILLADARPGDERLGQALRRLPSAAVSVLVEREQWIIPAPAIREATVVAHGNFELDHDGILRRFAATKQSGDRAYTALSLEAASILHPMAVPVGQTVAPAFRTAPSAIPVVSAADVLHGRHDAKLLRGKLVFVGPTALGLGDRVLTPVSRRLAPDPGVTVHAAATEALVRGEWIRALAPIGSGAIAGIIVTSILAARRRRARLVVATLATIAVLLGGGVLLATRGVAVPFVTLMLAVVITTALVEARAMGSALRASQADTIRLEEIATRLAEHQAQEVESKRILAHELKTPLASMRGLTQLLSGFELTEPERRRVTSLLEAETGKLQSMVTGLLDLERLPLRDFESSSTVTDLGELVAARIELLRTSAGRPLVASVPRGVPVRADAMLIERIVDNLVGNALKYTPPQSPVHVTVRSTAQSGVLEVEDRGPGIAETERERIFRRFVRGSTAAGTEGLGLGLSLVAEVARWHGGSVTVESPAEGGSRFRVTLPLAVEARTAGVAGGA